MAVNLEYYRVFYHVAAVGSITKAAEALCLTPPTVTKAIQNLEEQLDCQLFLRYSRGVHLTEAGEVLFQRVRPAFHMLMAGEHEIDQMNSLESGTVRIAMSEAAAHYFTMPAVFGRFCTRYPGIHLSIEHLSLSSAKEAVLSGEIDFAIMGLSETEDLTGLQLHEIYCSDNIAIVGAKYKDLADAPISLEELAGFPLIFVRGSYSVKRYYTEMYSRHELAFDPKIETPDLHMQLQAVKLGLGYSFAPYTHVREDLSSGALYRLAIKGEADYVRHICLMTPRNLPLSRAAKVLVDILLAAADEFSSRQS